MYTRSGRCRARSSLQARGGAMGWSLMRLNSGNFSLCVQEPPHRSEPLHSWWGVTDVMKYISEPVIILQFRANGLLSFTCVCGHPTLLHYSMFHSLSPFTRFSLQRLESRYGRLSSRLDHLSSRYYTFQYSTPYHPSQFRNLWPTYLINEILSRIHQVPVIVTTVQEINATRE